MEDTLRQLGELLFGAIPTVVLVTLLYASYRLLLHQPLERVLQERRARTEGAVEKARADIATAEARTVEYEQRLREAKAAVFRSQEQRRQEALKARAAGLAEARAKAQAQVHAARVAIGQDQDAAQTNLQAETERLAAEIIRMVLRPVASPARARGRQ